MNARLSAALADRYRIERELGSGGMATVYLAADLKHDRKVAIKVLKPELAAVLGAERFVVEIKTTASLQHPHILPLFDSGTADGFLFYVMPYIEGETIREKLNRETQFGIDEAVRIAREVADALDYAHRHGVIHRDIKPENILLHDGRAMVMDFGIALAVSAAAGGRMTETGLSLGTPHYMSPEQATAEKEITPRSDVYSLASVLYEMLAGQPPHIGGSAQQIIMKIIAESVQPVRSLRKSVPDNVEAALDKALEKLPADRFENAKAFADALVSPTFTTVRTGTAAVVSRTSRVPWLIAAASVVLAAVLAWNATSGSSSNATSVFANLYLEGVGLPSAGGNHFSVSPDGRYVALSVVQTSDIGLGVRALDSAGIRFLPRTAGADHLFWSPDSKSIGFFASESLKVVDLITGTVRTLCYAGRSHGGTWSRDGVILFSNGRALDRTTQSGSCEQMIQVAMDVNRSLRPYFFPDGMHFIATGDRRVWIGELGSDSLTPVMSPNRTEVVFVAPDYLLWRSGNGTLAQRVDVSSRSMIDEPVRLMTDVSNPGGHPGLSASESGLMVRSTIHEVPSSAADTTAPTGRRLAFIDRESGTMSFRATPNNVWGNLRYSRDGLRLALCGWNIQAMDVASGRWTRIAGPLEAGVETTMPAVWSPGDTALFYYPGVVPAVTRTVSFRTGLTRARPLRQPATGGFTIRGAESFGDWSPDGRHIAVAATADPRRRGMHAFEYDIAADSMRLLFEVTGSVWSLRYAPTGGWIAYEVADGASLDVYVRPYPGPGEPIRLSMGGGNTPRWSASGTELFFVNTEGDIVMAPVRRGMTAAIAEPRVVVARSAYAPYRIDQLDVSPNGKQFAVMLRAEVPSLSLILNWQALLPKK